MYVCPVVALGNHLVDIPREGDWFPVCRISLYTRLDTGSAPNTIRFLLMLASATGLFVVCPRFRGGHGFG